MKSLGVILQIDAPTPWCAGIVVVPKKHSSVRVCVDFRKLNESVLREVQPLPKVEETMAQLHGAVMFSKVDANEPYSLLVRASYFILCSVRTRFSSVLPIECK